jgi:GT2 family glycosyltransferase
LKSLPKISIVVLTYNNLNLTKKCLYSIDKYTNYYDKELIIVDNCSSDGTQKYLNQFKETNDYTTVILNDHNYGFAKGMNIGAQKANGDFIVFLNNDTYVTYNWLYTLLRHFQKNSQIGLICPSTNNIGNEAKISIQYNDMSEMSLKAEILSAAHSGVFEELPMVAFFCAMIPATVWKTIGNLDENYGIGWFEDDDYSYRVKKAGYLLGCARDVFIHHFGSASMNKLESATKIQLFHINHEYYEKKWQLKWQPPQYHQQKLLMITQSQEYLESFKRFDHITLLYVEGGQTFSELTHLGHGYKSATLSPPLKSLSISETERVAPNLFFKEIEGINQIGTKYYKTTLKYIIENNGIINNTFKNNEYKYILITPGGTQFASLTCLPIDVSILWLNNSSQFDHSNLTCAPYLNLNNEMYDIIIYDDISMLEKIHKYSQKVHYNKVYYDHFDANSAHENTLLNINSIVISIMEYLNGIYI